MRVNDWSSAENNFYFMYAMKCESIIPLKWLDLLNVGFISHKVTVCMVFVCFIQYFNSANILLIHLLYYKLLSLSVLLCFKNLLTITFYSFN